MDIGTADCPAVPDTTARRSLELPGAEMDPRNPAIAAASWAPSHRVVDTRKRGGQPDVPRYDRDYWTVGSAWIAEERAARRPSW
jgi:hypothetical protein